LSTLRGHQDFNKTFCTENRVAEARSCQNVKKLRLFTQFNRIQMNVTDGKLATTRWHRPHLRTATHIKSKTHQLLHRIV